jgi:hypothetical protein
MDGRARLTRLNGYSVRISVTSHTESQPTICAVAFDGVMITLAMWTMNIFHPGVFLRLSDHPYPTSSNDITPDKTGNDSEMKAV